jgi:hypothetical protein
MPFVAAECEKSGFSREELLQQCRKFLLPQQQQEQLREFTEKT